MGNSNQMQNFKIGAIIAIKFAWGLGVPSKFKIFHSSLNAIVNCITLVLKHNRPKLEEFWVVNMNNFSALSCIIRSRLFQISNIQFFFSLSQSRANPGVGINKPKKSPQSSKTP